ncbi:hypothetical protein B0H65DRAFT_449946 [Neurospora tetraspora]|uniref:Uncharacterized protein n=1 Tax=Neurospora tetraspora TaxID=94610 RepID=A0AAE0MWD1_9PEZI|nr:hypothetical protein B0H65DRAFT_449946 [Neurospora tetraspora]
MAWHGMVYGLKTGLDTYMDARSSVRHSKNMLLSVGLKVVLLAVCLGLLAAWWLLMGVADRGDVFYSPILVCLLARDLGSTSLGVFML